MNPSRRKFVYATPVILTLAAAPAFAKAGSVKGTPFERKPCTTEYNTACDPPYNIGPVKP